MYWVGNNLGLGGVGILVTEKWIDRMFDVKHVNNRSTANWQTKRSNCIDKGLTEYIKDKFSKIWSPLSQKMEKMSWSYLVVTSTDMLGRMQMVMMKFMEVLGVDVKMMQNDFQ